MTITLTHMDILALSPWFILVFGALLILMIESFCKEGAKKMGLGVTLVTLGCTALSLWFATDPKSEIVGSWLRFDAFSLYFGYLMLVIGSFVAFLGNSLFKQFERSQGEFYFLLLSAVFGLLLTAFAANFLTLFLGLETLSIALYVLCAYMKGWSFAIESAIKYFFTSSFATAFFLYGVALIYGATGTTALVPPLGANLVPGDSFAHTLFLGGIAFVAVGLLFKAAVVPFHFYAPDVYAGAANPVTAFLATGSKIAAFVALAEVFILAKPPVNPYFLQLMVFFALITFVIPNLIALRQTEIKRLMAYSGISHAGYLLIPIIVGTPEALYSLQFYLVVYASATLGVFACLIFLDEGPKGVSFDSLRGLFYRAPLLACVFALCLLTLAGVPPTAGFFAKLFVFKVAFEAGYSLLVIAGLLAAVFALFYYLRLVSLMFTKEEMGGVIKPAAIPYALALCSAFVIILFSLYPEILMDFR